MIQFSSVIKLMGIFALLNTFQLSGQDYIDISLPDCQIRGDKLQRGDGDTYGLGDWYCQFSFKLDGAYIEVRGSIRFCENANDFTTITGEFFQRYPVAELKRCQHCQLTIDDSQGFVKGQNIGARGYRWFDGQGLIRGASIQTDTFGDDVGKVGGTVQFAPVRVLVECAMAGN